MALSQEGDTVNKSKADHEKKDQIINDFSDVVTKKSKEVRDLKLQNEIYDQQLNQRIQELKLAKEENQQYKNQIKDLKKQLQLLEKDDEQAQIIDNLQVELDQKSNTIEWLKNEMEVNNKKSSKLTKLESQVKDLKEGIADRDDLLNEQ